MNTQNPVRFSHHSSNGASVVPQKPNVLARIETYKRQEIILAKQQLSPDAIRDMARTAPSPRGFVLALEMHLSSNRPALIAEIKKASPSKGIIRTDFNPSLLARAYLEGGATCLSVLTDEPSFKGHPDYLKLAREASGLPVLRKDFLFEAYQVYQSRAWGADCILVIMASVTDAEARELVTVAHDLGMDVLVEVHDMQELERAIPLGTRLIGINNRDLRTFEVTLETTEIMAPYVPSDRIVVCESGMSSHSDVTRLRNAGVHTFLVGASLMRQQDVTNATRSLIFGESLNPDFDYSA